MSIKEKMLLRDGDVNIKINIGVDNKMNNQKEGIEAYIDKKSDNIINSVIDREIRQYGFNQDGKQQEHTLGFHVSGDTWNGSLINADFTEDELSLYSSNLKNSFFIFDFFDDYLFNSRTKIFTQYFTKLNEIIKNETFFHIEEIKQLNTLNIPNFHHGDKLYLRILFYNAKTGNITPFENTVGEGEEKQFFIIDLKHDEYEWSLEDDKIDGIEIINNEKFKDRLNETNKTLKMKDQTYPTGKKFNYIEGKYEEI